MPIYINLLSDLEGTIFGETTSGITVVASVYGMGSYCYVWAGSENTDAPGDRLIVKVAKKPDGHAGTHSGLDLSAATRAISMLCFDGGRSSEHANSSLVLLVLQIRWRSHSTIRK